MTSTPTAEGIHHRAEELGAGLPPLLVAAERVAATVSQGVHGRRRVGQGETFWQFRRYQAGDSVQQVDWRQSAKSDPVYIRETEWEAAQSVWLWSDNTASMDFRSSPGLPSKRARASLLALALAALLIRGGEHVALSGAARPPSAGRAMLLEMAAMLSTGTFGRPAGDLTEYGSAQQGMPPDNPMPRNSRIVLFSDFLDPTDSVRAGLDAIAAKGVHGHMVRIVDPAEESLPYSGRVLFEDSEGGGEVLLDNVESIRREYATEWRRHGEKLAALARASGCDYIVHHTDQPAEEALLQLYLHLSEQGGG